MQCSAEDKGPARGFYRYADPISQGELFISVAYIRERQAIALCSCAVCATRKLAFLRQDLALTWLEQGLGN